MSGLTFDGKGLPGALRSLSENGSEEAMLDGLLEELRAKVDRARALVFSRGTDGKVAVLAGRAAIDGAEVSQVRALADAVPFTIAFSTLELPASNERISRSAWLHGIPSVREPGPLGILVVVTSEVRELSESERSAIETTARLAGALLDARRSAFVAAYHRKLYKELSTRERMAMVGAMAASLAHEINSPLAAVSGNVAVLFDEFRELELRGAVPAEEADELLRSLGEAKESASRVAAVVRDLMVLAHDGNGRSVAVDLRQAVDTATRLLRGELRHRARLTVDVVPGTSARGDNAKIVQLLVHLLREAIEALPDNRPDRHEILIRVRRDANLISVEVHDSGPSPSEEALERAFEPFFSLRGRGATLGLSVCQELVSTLDGHLLLLRSPLGGVCFRAELPAAVVEQAEPPTVRAERRRVLVVDDEPTMCSVVSRMLRKSYAVTTFTDAREALASVARGDGYDVVLCDVMMPGMSGMEFLEQLTQTSPALAKRTGFLTAGAFTERARSFLQAEGRQYVDKPVDIPTLTRLVEQLAAF
jgi:signal transduction histidine kinase/CheY-like chemotaxis protein